MRQHFALSDWAFVAKILGFTAGTIISILLVSLVGQSVSRRGLRQPHGFVAIAILVWNLFGLAATALLLADDVYRATCVIQAISFGGGALLPFAVVNVWRQLPGLSPRAQRAGGFWAALSLGVGLSLSAAFLATALAGPVYHMTMDWFFKLMPVSDSILLTGGAWILLRGQRQRQGVYPGLAALLVGMYVPAGICVLFTLGMLPPGVDVQLLSICDQSGLMALLGLLFFFSNFRFADVFIRRSLGVAAALGASLAVVSLVPLLQHELGVTNRRSAWQVALGILIGAVLLAAPAARWAIDRCVHGWFYRQPDYRQLLRQIGQEFEELTNPEDLLAALERHAASVLGLAASRVVERSAVENILEVDDGELLELPCRHPASALMCPHAAAFVLPVRAGARIPHVLLIDPGCSRRNLLSEEASFLRRLVALAGGRLDAIERERERINVEAGQERLVRQVTEAELRALRAQVNPHFLFNSLNTIAALIPTDPGSAEIMTVRLAKVFRHVLASSERQLASLEEEMRFIETYLSIEQARFGDRLNVRLEFDPLLAAEPVPSLLLQPVVENALKHGLAPKPGKVHLAVSARRRGEFLCLEVEDDGVGPSAREDRKEDSHGVGLRNLVSRLANLYGDGATLRLEPRPQCGSRVTILIPSFSNVG